MKIYLKFTLHCVCLLLLLISQSCGDQENDPTPAEETVTPDPVVTGRGTPNGSSVSQSVGTSGGVVTSSDGLLTVTIPAGALSSAKTITIQPITNEVSLGVGNGYRLGPEGTTFLQPATLTFKYNEGMLDNKPAATLWITTQNTDGSWSANIRSVVDETAKTVTAKTSHFSDWSLGRFIDFKIAPSSATVMVGTSISLGLVGFSKDKEVQDSPDDLVPLSPIVDDGLEPLAPLTPIPPVESRLIDFRVKNWSLNGVNAPVSNANGSLTASGNSCKYSAPSKRPSGGTVAVTAELETTNKEGSKSKLMVVSNITIIEGKYYLRVTIDGTEYLYIQYGVDGTIPPSDNFAMVNAALADGDVFTFGGGYYNGSELTNSFAAVFESPGTGTASVSCLNDHDSDDDVAFIYSAFGRRLSNAYIKRWKEGDVCQSEYLCGNFSRTFTRYENKSFGEVEGSFSGIVYEAPDGDGSGDNCQTPNQYNISGEFKLVRVQ